MQRPSLGVVALLSVGFWAGCGGSEQSRVRTPEDLLAEEMAAAEEQAARSDQDLARFEESSTDSEDAAQFDEDQADLELRRATRSAQDCPMSLPPEDQENFQEGVARVTLTFSNEGRVKEKSISANYEDGRVGACVLRAMGAVIVPVYQGPEKTIEHEIELKIKDEQADAESAKEDSEK